MLSEAKKREKVANALLGLAFATSAAQSPKDFVRTGNIESPGTALMQTWEEKEEKQNAIWILVVYPIQQETKK